MGPPKHTDNRASGVQDTREADGLPSKDRRPYTTDNLRDTSEYIRPNRMHVFLHLSLYRFSSLQHLRRPKVQIAPCHVRVLAPFLLQGHLRPIARNPFITEPVLRPVPPGCL